MKIKPPTRSILDPQRHQECADALEPYIYALLRIADDAPAPESDPDFGQIREAARASGWDEVTVLTAIDFLSLSYVMAGRPYRAADTARGLKRWISE
ncbi:MAG: hypothetical protein IBJ07_10690 [Rhizobiaceae bacterium]|nr:hypothetical protein [Rhizobiaceae bacterium]